MNLKGFIPKIGLRTTPVEDCESALKAFVGLALACHIVKAEMVSLHDELYENIYVFSQRPLNSNGADM